MGRIKGFLCSFCLDTHVESVNGDTTFDRSIDVSHLATPHVTLGPTVKADRSNPSPQTEGDSAENRLGNSVDSQELSNPSNYSSAPVQQHNDFELSQPNSYQQNLSNEELSSHIRPESNLTREADSSRQTSPPGSQPSHSNYLVPLQNEHSEQALIEVRDQQHQHQVQEQLSSRISQPSAQPPLVAARNSLPSTSTAPATKLSYDIISVREPLAKILAERQQLLVGQQQQRQALGDHEYIEVYGERGSSCFYEEIAGSVTSSATYDQIGSNSNHNYQVLINAYAVANRQPVANHINHESNYTAQTSGSSSNSNDKPGTSTNHNHENTYDVTVHPDDRVDGPLSDPESPNNNSNEVTISNNAGTSSCSTHPNLSDIGTTDLTQSIPVYSVINKATRRRNPMVRAAYNDNRPPKPPPKNSFISHRMPNTSAISHEDPSSVPQEESSKQKSRNTTPRVPSTSSFMDENQAKNLGIDSTNHRSNRLPQPPPRPSKNSAFNHTADRPLPSPNGNLDKLNNNNQSCDQNALNIDDDIESMNNGYELLRTNFEDDQIDVGYEKIRESNRYSGGSISSQFYSKQLLDNGGYESVQPIYSSPSNCYEALNPATASEIAAAAAAKLNTLEKFSNNDRGSQH